ncbi:MAG: hypothetical protein AB7F74_07345 [Parvibaculaceae bacterium]
MRRTSKLSPRGRLVILLDGAVTEAYIKGMLAARGTAPDASLPMRRDRFDFIRPLRT